MKENGDDKIQSSEWALQAMDTTTGEGSSLSRKIEYTHPVNAPMAPPMARARKEQTLRRYGDLGLILETKTFVDDVPMTDCFYVADRIRVERRGDGKVSVTMQFDVRFVKGTMFKAIISRTTKREINKFMNQLAGFMSKSLSSSSDYKESAIVQEVESMPVEPPTNTHVTPPPTAGISSRTPIYVLLGSVLVLQLWILMDMRFMRAEMRQLQMTMIQVGLEGSMKVCDSS
jgi:hypothetical protein